MIFVCLILVFVCVVDEDIVFLIVLIRIGDDVVLINGVVVVVK